MSRPSIALVLVAFLALPGAAQAGEKYALVVGVDRYRDDELSSLNFPDDDATQLGSALEGLGFDVVTMTAAADKVALRPDAPADILTALERRLKTCGRDDIIVVSLSGHGVQLVGDEPRADGSRETYFCPARARLNDRSTLLPISQVIGRLAGCPARRKLLLVDACRNDPAPPATGKARDVIVEELDPAAPARRQTPDGLVALFSCSPKEKSFELPALGHSVFSYHVIEYLAGRADDPARWYDGGQATLTDLVAYATKRTARTVERDIAAFQTPELVGRMTDWSFGAVGGSLASVDRKPAMDRPLPTVPPMPKPAAGRKPGEVVENSLGMKLVVIPAGQFQMGGETVADLENAGIEVPDFLKEFIPAERPVHRVRITKPFLLGQTEVTLGQFLEFYNDGYQGRLDCEQDGEGGWGYDAATGELGQKPQYRPWSWGHPDMDIATEAGKRTAFGHPVVNVSWNDCVAFCAWLSRKEGKTYRLPTEAEWEYACRAGTTTRYWTGDDPESLAASENIADGTLTGQFPGAKDFAVRGRDGHVFTAPVGSFDRVNPFGLADMQGNVAEWCSDWYDSEYYAKSPGADPMGLEIEMVEETFDVRVPIEKVVEENGKQVTKKEYMTETRTRTRPVAGSFRVIRGGSWLNGPVGCRSAGRGVDSPAARSLSIGFRVVCELE